MQQLRQYLKSQQMLIQPTRLLFFLQVIMADGFPESMATANTFLKQGKCCSTGQAAPT